MSLEPMRSHVVPRVIDYTDFCGYTVILKRFGQL